MRKSAFINALDNSKVAYPVSAGEGKFLLFRLILFLQAAEIVVEDSREVGRPFPSTSIDDASGRIW